MGDGIMSLPPRLAISRRGAMAGFAAGAAAASVVSARPALAGIPAARRLAFDVYRNNKPIGTHLVTFEQVGANMEVRVQLDLVVRWAGIVIYRYAVRVHETWRGGTMAGAHGETNDDGTRHAMRASRRDGQLVVEGTHGPTYVAPAKSIVSTHWNPSQLDAPMISAQDGQLLDFKIDALGRGTIARHGGAIEADRFALTGPATLDLWYDRQRIWTKLKAVSWEGSMIEYRPV